MIVRKSAPLLTDEEIRTFMNTIWESCVVRSSSVVALSPGTVGRIHDGGAGTYCQIRFAGSLPLATPNKS
jgi:hypothetical protein